MNIISITEGAQRHLTKWIEKEDANGVYLTLKKTGCSGWQYDIKTISQPPKGIIRQEFDHFILFMDASMVGKIQGTVVDLEKLSLGQSKLNFKNPHAKARCGCGESFNWDEQGA
jgi:iron-sulfur cluster assembly protein|tara:strand:+ start:8500 stop:8841 length:342 start_codon:yes stop_codon:yes gene_type:complete